MIWKCIRKRNDTLLGEAESEGIVDSKRVEQIKVQFDVVLQTTEEKIEFWYARDLMKFLE